MPLFSQSSVGAAVSIWVAARKVYSAGSTSSPRPRRARTAAGPWRTPRARTSSSSDSGVPRGTVTSNSTRNSIIVPSASTGSAPPATCGAADGLQVEGQVVLGSGAAQQHFAEVRFGEGVGGVDDRAGQQRGRAGVADTGAAGPSRRDVACFGHLEQAGLVFVEGDGQAGAGEGD